MARVAAVVVHVSSAWVGKQVVRLLVQVGDLIQSVLHLAGSIALDTARKLSLEVLAVVQAVLEVLGEARYSTPKCLLVQAGS